MKNKNAIKRTLKEFAFGLLSIAITVLFMLICVFLAAENKEVDGGLVAFICVCAAIAGLTPICIRLIRRHNDEEKLGKAIDDITKGDFATELPDVSPDLEPAKRAAEKLKDAYEFAEKKQTDFIDDFAHELKTPIVSIRGFAKLLANGDADEDEKKEYLALIVSESDRLIDLTANTLMLSRLGMNSAEVEKSKFRLDELARKEILLLQEKWESKNIDVTANLDEEEVCSNEELVGQMILNVVENAVKYTAENGHITVTSGKTPDGVFLKIKDDGEGMNAETQARIFDRYYRGDPARKKGGNGLGLATVKRIAEVLGIKITVESSPGQGSEFTFLF